MDGTPVISLGVVRDACVPTCKSFWDYIPPWVGLIISLLSLVFAIWSLKIAEAQLRLQTENKDSAMIPLNQ